MLFEFTSGADVRAARDVHARVRRARKKTPVNKQGHEQVKLDLLSACSARG